MNKAQVYCEVCDKWYTVDYGLTSGLFEMKCPNCGCEDIWFGDIDCDKSGEIQFGVGGCSQK